MDDEQLDILLMENKPSDVELFSHALQLFVDEELTRDFHRLRGSIEEAKRIRAMIERTISELTQVFDEVKQNINFISSGRGPARQAKTIMRGPPVTGSEPNGFGFRVDIQKH